MYSKQIKDAFNQFAWNERNARTKRRVAEEPSRRRHRRTLFLFALPPQSHHVISMYIYRKYFHHPSTIACDACNSLNPQTALSVGSIEPRKWVSIVQPVTVVVVVVTGLPASMPTYTIFQKQYGVFPSAIVNICPRHVISVPPQWGVPLLQTPFYRHMGCESRIQPQQGILRDTVAYQMTSTPTHNHT